MDWVEIFTFSEYLGDGVLEKCPHRDFPISLGTNENVSAIWMVTPFCRSRGQALCPDGQGFSLARDHAGSQLVVPSCETVCVFEKGEILCAAHLSFLLLTDDSGLFVGSLLCVRLQDQPENQAGWREE